MKFAYVIGDGSARRARKRQRSPRNIRAFILDRGNTPTRATLCKREDGLQLPTTNDEALRVIVCACVGGYVRRTVIYTRLI